MPQHPAKISQFFRNARWLFHRYGTAASCARHTGICRPHLYNLMSRDKRVMPSLLVAHRIAEYYGYELSELMQSGIEFEKLAKKKRPTPPLRKTPMLELLEPTGLKMLKKLRKKERQRRKRK